VQTWVVMNDLQMPFHDKQVVELVVSFVERLKPYGVVLNGDVVDCYQLSDFTKDPMKGDDLRKGIDLSQKLMKRLGKVSKERWWLCGNHEDRLRRYVWKNAPALGVVEGMNFPTLFKIEDCGFKWKGKDKIIRLGKLIVVHGDVARKHSAYTAKCNFETFGCSVLTGHSHRLGIYYCTNQRGIHASYENGCLCPISNAEFAPFANWQQGFSVVHVDDSGTFHVQQIPILGRKSFYYGSERYWVKKR